MIHGKSNFLTIPQGVLLGAGLNPTFVATFALFVAIILLWTIAWGKILKKAVRLPVIAGQIIGGILLGPSCINIQGYQFFAVPLQLIDTVSGKFYALASSDLFIFFILLISSAFTVSYLLWIAGHETDIQDILKVGVTAVSAGIFGALLPILMTVAIVSLFFSESFTLAQSIALGLMLSATSVSIPIAMLFAQNKMHLKSSRATLGAAIIDDILTVILLSVFFITAQAGMFGFINQKIHNAHHVGAIEAIVYMIVSFAVIFFTGYFIVPPIIRWLKRQHFSHLITPVANGLMLLYFAFAELVGGLAGITGAYFAGLFHRMGDDHHHAEKVISPFVNAILLPLFLGSIGLQVDISILTMSQWIIVFLLLIVAIISKLAGCFLATFLSNISGRRAANRWNALESYLFGASMVARGEVGLVVATILQGSQVITSQQYVIAVVIIVLTTIAAPIMLALGFYRLDLVQISPDTSTGFSLNIGLFDIIGTTQMFNIIIDRIEATKAFNTSVYFSEGCKIINLEGHNVKIILSPEKGIIFKGNRENIDRIIRLVKSSILEEVELLSVMKGL